MDKIKELTLEGIVMPVETNRHGRPTQIMLETQDFDQYIIAPSRIAQDLEEYLFEEVSLVAVPDGEDEDGKTVITVIDFDPAEERDEYFEDDDSYYEEDSDDSY